MRDILMPYISEGLTILIQIAVLALFYGLYLLRDRVKQYISAHLDAKQAEMVSLLGKEAYAFAETVYSELQGPDKLSHALDYFEQQAKSRGIPFDATAARAAIEKAWLEVEGAAKKSAS